MNDDINTQNPSEEKIKLYNEHSKKRGALENMKTFLEQNIHSHKLELNPKYTKSIAILGMLFYTLMKGEMFNSKNKTKEAIILYNNFYLILSTDYKITKIAEIYLPILKQTWDSYSIKKAKGGAEKKKGLKDTKKKRTTKACVK
jgi:hypothetical protein